MITNLQHIIVEQECSACGHRFSLRYHSNGTYTYLDEPCECEADFHPIVGPSLSEWLAQIQPKSTTVSRDDFEAMRADRDSWKDAFGESNEKIAQEVKHREAVERENKRLRAIIVQHFPGDKLCSLCKHFDRCKQEALDEEDNAAESLFWNCDGYQHFDIDMDKVPGEGV